MRSARRPAATRCRRPRTAKRRWSGWRSSSDGRLAGGRAAPRAWVVPRARGPGGRGAVLRTLARGSALGALSPRRRAARGGGAAVFAALARVRARPAGGAAATAAARVVRAARIRPRRSDALRRKSADPHRPLPSGTRARRLPAVRSGPPRRAGGVAGLRAIEHERPKVLWELCCEHLLAERIVRPPVDALVRMIASARERAHITTHELLSPQLQGGRPQELDRLLIYASPEG